MPVSKIAISFALSTIIVILNKQFIGEFSIESGDVWSKWYYTINALSYAIPSLTINHYLKGWKKYAFTLVPTFYLEWAYSSWYYQGGISCLDFLQMIIGASIVYLLSNYSLIKSWIRKTT